MSDTMDTTEDEGMYDVHFRYTLSVAARNPFHAVQLASAELATHDAGVVKASLVASGCDPVVDEDEEGEGDA